MKALVKYKKGKGFLEIRDVPVPEPDESEVRIKIKYTSVCGTDIKIMDDKFPYNPPVIIGHEFSGVIDKAGSKVKNWEYGDRVVSEQHTKACSACRYCMTGNRHLCSKKKAPGYGVNGAFAEYITMPALLIHKIPDNVSYKEACLIEPMAIAAYAIFEKTKIQLDDVVAIIGCGPIALLALQMVKANGASKVFMTGINADEKIRFKAAKRFCADRVINVRKEDPVKIIMDSTNNIGVDVVIELSGSPNGIMQGFDIIRKNGRFCALGLCSDKINAPWMNLILKAVNIFFSYSSDYLSWERCLSMVSNKKMNLNPFTKDLYTLDKWEEAFKKARKGDSIKAIIKL